MLTRENTRAGWPADGVSAVGAMRNHPLLSQPINPRSGRDVFKWPTVGRNSIHRVIIGEKEDDIRSAFLLLSNR